MKPAELRHLITIQNPPSDQDSFGQPTGSWTTFAQIWAKVETDSTTENTQAKSKSDGARYTVTSYWVEGITPKMRVLWGSHVLDIYGVQDHDNTGRFVEIECGEAI